MLEKGRRSEGYNGNSDQLHLTKALEPKPVEFAFSFVRNIPHHARLGGGDHDAGFFRDVRGGKEIG